MQAKNEFSMWILEVFQTKIRFVLLCRRHQCVRKVVGAFGLISKLSLGTSLCMTKNLQVCGYCDAFTKFITKIGMVPNHANHFHHFEDCIRNTGTIGIASRLSTLRHLDHFCLACRMLESLMMLFNIRMCLMTKSVSIICHTFWNCAGCKR